MNVNECRIDVRNKVVRTRNGSQKAYGNVRACMYARPSRDGVDACVCTEIAKPLHLYIHIYIYIYVHIYIIYA